MTRRERIAELYAADYRVSEIAAIVGIEPRRVFRHLAILRAAGDPRVARYRPQCPLRRRASCTLAAVA
jgi:predicted ArsR family transcriptional regulator